MDDYYPTWLGQSLIDNRLPWEQAVESTMPRFLDAYTLHDSYWIGFHLGPDFVGVAAIRFDTHWTNGRISFPGSQVADWPILLIQLEKVRTLQIGAAAPDLAIAGAQSAELVGAGEGQYRTVFSHIIGSDVECIHAGKTRFLCLDREKLPLAIPGVSMS